MIQTFLFDLGNVLLHFSHERMCRQVGELADTSAAAVHTWLFESELQWEFESGRIDEAEFHRRFEAFAGRAVDRDELAEAASRIFEPNEPMFAILDALQARGHRLVLISNTCVSHVRHIERTYDLLDRFDARVLSYEVGASKPEPQIYRAALRAIECDPHDCFYTDDIPEYVDRARGYGLQAEVFIDPRGFVDHLQRRGLPLEI